MSRREVQLIFQVYRPKAGTLVKFQWYAKIKIVKNYKKMCRYRLSVNYANAVGTRCIQSDIHLGWEQKLVCKVRLYVQFNFSKRYRGRKRSLLHSFKVQIHIMFAKKKCSCPHKKCPAKVTLLGTLVKIYVLRYNYGHCYSVRTRGLDKSRVYSKCSTARFRSHVRKKFVYIHT